MQGLLYEETSVWLFLLVTVALGGGGAWMAGRAAATGWKHPVQLAVYLLLLAIAVRFIHHALFGGTMFSLHYYVVDAIFVLVIGFLAFRVTRTRQMVTQYGWLYERSGPLSWQARRPDGQVSAKT
jgi:hypothetical protein